MSGPSEQSTTDATRILIAGAGVAGLSAAAELHRRGHTNVKVFEARSRLGGRISTLTPKCETSHLSGGEDAVIELGAQWVHGQRGNPVFEICCAEKRRIGGVQDLLDLDAPVFFEKFFHWHQLDEHQNEYMAHLADILEELNDECQSQSDDYTSGQREEEVAPSLEAFFEKRFKTLLEEETDPDKQKMLRWFLDWALRFENEVNGGEAKEMSANLIGQYHECEGNITTELGPRGYKAFIDLLLRGIPAETIFTETEITHIDYSVQPIKVTSTRGVEEFDHVICCLPLGVLKRKSRLFAPELPLRKVKTIDALGFGTCNKIYLEFAEKDVFWTAGDVFQVLWKDNNLLPGEVGEGDQDRRQKEWYRSIDRLNAVRNTKCFLVAWIAGSAAREMETVPENEVLAECCKILAMVTGREDLPRPQRIIRSMWSSDPFSRGSYSFISTACDQGPISMDPKTHYSLLPATLAEPIVIKDAPGLCFAGEATSNHFYSTVHGAYESGVREASRLSDYLSSKEVGIRNATITDDKQCLRTETNKADEATGGHRQDVTFDPVTSGERFCQDTLAQFAPDANSESLTKMSANSKPLEGHHEDATKQNECKRTEEKVNKGDDE